MSLGIALSSALTGLQHAQTALQVTSNNIANVNTDGYTRKSVASINRIIGGVGSGVMTTEIARSVDENLLREYRIAVSKLGFNSVQNDYLARSQDMFGTPENSDSLASTVAGFGAKLEALAASPEDITTRQQAVDAAVGLARQINSMADQIQSQRALADQEISRSVDAINTNLNKIAELNHQIAHDAALGRSSADLLDQRDLALKTLSEHLDVTYFTRDTGELVIQTSGGQTLLDTEVHALSHTPAAQMSASVTHAGGGIDGITVNGVDITDTLRSGRLAALVGIRDSTLPDLTAQLDEFAQKFSDSINAIHNDGAGFPAANALTGTRSVAGSDAVAGSGTARIAVVDANGNAVAAPLDLDLSTTSDVNAVVAAINADLGPAGKNVATASITANGHLEITATDPANGIAINEGDSDIDGRGFSHYFGLNDLFVGDPSVSLASTLAVRSDIAADPQLLSRGEVASGAIAASDNAVASGDNRVVQRLAQAFQGNVAFSAAGGLPAMNTTFADFATQILSTNANAAAEASDGLKFSSGLVQNLDQRIGDRSGVNIDEELSNLTVLQNAYAASARVVSVTNQMMQILNDMVR